jgi:cob(I)alamin adenosyltransferase
MNKGLIHIYTGDGKGKTTAAVGLCVRARSRGLSVCFAQFMKQGAGGEPELLEKLSVRVIRFEKVLSPHFNPQADMKTLRREALRALDELSPMLPEFDLLVLDEFTHVLANGLITAEEARRFIKDRPGRLELVFTGRGAPEWLIDLADNVTDMLDVKHPLKRGVSARKGIDY